MKFPTEWKKNPKHQPENDHKLGEVHPNRPQMTPHISRHIAHSAALGAEDGPVFGPGWTFRHWKIHGKIHGKIQCFVVNPRENPMKTSKLM